MLKHDYGQLGNRLHTHANALAWCLEKKLDLLNLSFVNYAHHFQGGRQCSADRHLLQSPILRVLLRIPRMVGFLQRIALSDRHLSRLGSQVRLLTRADDETLTEEDLNHAANASPRPRVMLVRAWDIQCPNALSNQSDRVRKVLTPEKNYVEEVNRLLASLPPHDFLVGIHARRGDYANWQDGRHFHSWEQYREWLLQVHDQLLEKKRKPAYLICSDELPPQDAFDPIKSAMSSRSLMTDLHALSCCQLILGPPSSFGSWASFYGKVPRLCLQKNETITSLPLQPHS